MPTTRSKLSSPYSSQATLLTSLPPDPPAFRTRARTRSAHTPISQPPSQPSCPFDPLPSSSLIPHPSTLPKRPIRQSLRPDSPRPNAPASLRRHSLRYGSGTTLPDQLHPSPGSPQHAPSSPSSSDLRECSCSPPSQDLDPTLPGLTKPGLLQLPAEILDQICSQVADVPSLLSLALTHRKLNAFASKTLYRAPQISSRYTAWRLRTGLRSRLCLPAYVRVLDIDLAKLCRASMWASWHLQETGGAFVDIVSQCLELVHFRVQMPKEASMFIPDFITPIRNLINLQTFYKDIRHDQDAFYEAPYHRSTPAAWISMPQLLQAIGHLPHLHTLAVRGLGSTLSSRPIFKSQPIFAHLRTLIIVQTSIKERDLQQLLRYRSGLVSLTLIESTCISKRGLVEALQTCGGALEELTIGPGWWGKSDTSYPLDDVIGSLPRLRKLNVEGDLLSPHFFSLTYATCPPSYSTSARHVEQSLVRLESLCVRRCQSLRPEPTLAALRKMAEHAPRHRTLGSSIGPTPVSRRSKRAKIVTRAVAAAAAENDDGGASMETPPSPTHLVIEPPIQRISLGNLFRLGWRHQDIVEAGLICKPGLFDLGFDP